MILYDIAVSVASALLPLLELSGKEKLKAFAKGRKGLNNEIHSRLGSYSGKTIWMHCSSLGEFEQGRPLLEAIRKREPDTRLVLTFFSPSGYEPRKGYDGADHIFYLPLDTKKNVRRFLSDVRPSEAYFVKYEFWPNFLLQASKAGIRTYLVSGIFRREQVFFKWYGGFMRRVLKSFTGIFVQDENSRRLLSSIGYKKVEVTGDTRFDRVYRIAQSAEHFPEVERFAGDSPCVVFGSTWPSDEEIIVRYINETSRPIKFILVPHEVHEENIVRLSSMIEKPLVRYTEIASSDISNVSVLIVDTIGILSSLYRYAEISFVGGGFDRDGIHNCLEPAVFGCPVVFGPVYSKYNEAVGLVSAGGALPVGDYAQFRSTMERLVSDREFARQIGGKSREFIQRGLGATEQILSFSEK